MCEAARKPVCLCSSGEGQEVQKAKEQSQQVFLLYATITVLGRPMRLDLCWREGARSVEEAGGQGRGHRMQQEQGGPGRTPCLRASPDKPILSSAQNVLGHMGAVALCVSPGSCGLQTCGSSPSLSGRGHAPWSQLPL